jgi:peptidoglycan/LPS O-acetylase OafA/YrhL
MQHSLDIGRRQISGRAIRVIAKYSFGIYLLHSIVATILFQVLSPDAVGAQNTSFGNVHSFGALSLVAAGLGITRVLAKGRLKTVELYGAHGVRMMLGPKKMPVAATS